PFLSAVGDQPGSLVVRVAERDTGGEAVSQPHGNAWGQSQVLFVSVTSLSADVVIWSEEFSDGPAHPGLGEQVSAWAHEGIHGQQLAAYIHLFQDSEQFQGDGGNNSGGNDGDSQGQNSGTTGSSGSTGNGGTGTVIQVPVTPPVTQPSGGTSARADTT